MTRVLVRPVLGLVAVAALCAGCGDDGPAARSSHQAAAPSSTPTEPAGPAPRCSPGSLEPEVVRSGSVGSAPFVTVALRNAGDQACRLVGYPTLTAHGTRPDGRAGSLPIRVRHGAIYERKDPGAHLVRLEPGEAAVFHVGTATAYDVGGATITKLTFGLRDGRDSAFVVPVHLDASR